MGGTISVSALAFLLHRGGIFEPGDPGFRLVSLGIAGSIAYVLTVFVVWWSVVPFAILYIILHLSVGGFVNRSEMAAEPVYISAAVLAVYVYATVYCRYLNEVPLGRAFILAGLGGIFFLGAAVGLGFLAAIHSFDLTLLWECAYGCILGFGLGLGFEAAQKILVRIKIN